MQDRILTLTGDSMQTLTAIAETRITDIAALARIMVDALMQDQRIFCCGNGASAANALSFVSKLANRYERERPAFPVIMLGQDSAVLTAIAADVSFQDVFARPLQALARPGDLLLALSASGSAINVAQAARIMQGAGGRVLALTGEDGGELGRTISPTDFHLRLPGNCLARIHEAQLFVLNCCCDLIDREFFGANDV
ncbi:MAG: SIS domain-containing protein [Moraxellaceae bacterium]|jgi:phosphoheptose isomerase|nr:SIS domain-containing protein [Moraxellaceae bacterium]MBP7229239.1 SIS domain-containing protein [Moraxellaceae bacterium]MBP8851647.1 SIS domain-containing protein [Moraxellaceae bacterium]MBP9729987.1 SIS domain-containing protein [Moraxellaceae bacterium]MCC6199382.1 SIS domain-containing protein [Moraxellaceae bacterium]